MSEGVEKPSSSRSLRRVAAVAGLIFLWPALVTFDPGDWPSPHQYPHNDPVANACGSVGAAAAYCLRHYLGDGAWPLLLFATFATVTWLARGRVGSAVERGFGLVLLVACTAASSHLISSQSAAALPVGNGGAVGLVLGDLLIRHVSNLGAIIILGSCAIVGLIFATEGWVLRLPEFLAPGSPLMRRVGAVLDAATGFGRRRPAAVGAGGVQRSLLPPRAPSGRASVRPPRDLVRIPGPSATDAAPDAAATHVTLHPASVEGAVETVPIMPPAQPTAAGGPDADADGVAGDGPAATGDIATTVGSSARRPVVVNFPRPQKQQPLLPYPRMIENWELPSLTLLDDPEYGFTAQQEAIVREKARVLERTLEEFRLDAHVVEIDTGPVITMFELKLAPGIKVSQIATLSNDIARALKAPAIRVVAPIPGKNTVGIEVPNVEKEKVRLKELMMIAGDRCEKMALPIFIGKNASGEALIHDLARAPHLLIAGTTGSGKSVCMNSIIVSLLMTKAPDRVKLILIDPKMVEMSQFKDVPHLMCPIVTEMARAEKILEWAVTKMDERYELLAEAGVRHIVNFNELGKEKIYERLKPSNEQEKAAIPTYMPYIVIMIDELADLMMTSAKEVEHHLSRLAQKSRAVGIHIVVATQRPEAKVVTGLIKSNLPCRIAFRVASRMDSRIVLDQNGGEVLMGQGDMLFLPPGSHKLLRCQGTYLEDAEIHRVLTDLSVKGKPEFHPELSRIKADEEGSSGERDPLFNEAVRIVLQTKRGSVSLLQRRLTIGYSRASRLIDQMAEAGIVGDYKGSQAREVNITLKEWEAMQRQVQQDLADEYAADAEDFGADADDEADDGDEGASYDGSEGDDDQKPP